MPSINPGYDHSQLANLESDNRAYERTRECLEYGVPIVASERLRIANLSERQRSSTTRMRTY